ncbi:uncharacterized protein TNCV_3808951 [Trichonephila clavipes]|nr:uncharacterized protein TNCV_3808951 [Trichonephila clavipes]
MLFRRMASQFGENSLRNVCLAFIQLNFNFLQRIRGLVGRSSAYYAGVYLYTLQYALLIGYEHSLDNARFIAFSQRHSSTHLIEDETFNDSDIINNLKDYEDGQEEPGSLRVDSIYAEIQLSDQSEKYFLKIDTNSKRNLKFQKELRSCIPRYRAVPKQLTIVLKTYHLPYGAKNKSIEIVSSSDESDFELIHHRKMHALDYDE